MKVYTQRQA